MNARLAESLDGLEVVKGAAQEDAEVTAFTELADDVRDHFIQQGRIEARFFVLSVVWTCGCIWVPAFLNIVSLWAD